MASSNAGKLAEIRALLGDLAAELRPLADFPGVLLPEESDEYEANAIAKAVAAARASGRLAIGDDSGLEVAGLGGAPGPRSARFGGPGLTDVGRTGALLEAMVRLRGEQRRARFVCVAALATSDGDIVTARGECAGHILETPRGQGGFGYDPVFRVEGGASTMAELGESEKNRVSHRARAFEALRPALEVRI